MIGVSTRQLSLLRMALAILWIFTLLSRWPFISLHFTEDGLLPWQLAKTISDNTDALSFNFFFSSEFAQKIIFILAFICGLAQFVGYQTRIASILTFIFMVSIDSRNQFLLNAGYETIRVLQFWCLFLPLDEFYTYKDLREARTKVNTTISSWFAKGLVLQILCMYFFGALLKTSPEWFSRGEAIEMALSNHFMTFPWAQNLLSFSSLYRYLSPVVFLFELVAPIVIFVLWKQQLLRKTLVLSLVLFHISILVLFKVGFLPVANICMLICLWPMTAVVHTEHKQRTGKQWAGALLVGYLAVINIHSYLPFAAQAQGVLMPARWLLLDQAWMFFAPRPYTFDGWWSLEVIDREQKTRQIKISGEDLKQDAQDYYWRDVQMEEKTFLIHLLKSQYTDYRYFILESLCKRDPSAQEIVLKFYWTDLPRTSVTLEFIPRELARVVCK